MLDAIYYSCFTRSYFTKSDAANVLHEALGFRIEAHFQRNELEEKVVCILRETGKKEFLVNEEAYAKMSQHIGKYPAVMICPDDVEIITGSGEIRRRFLDTLLSQADPIYLQHLISYTRILQQRNSLLKLHGENRSTDLSLLDIYDEQLSRHGQYIFTQRSRHLEKLCPLIQSIYTRIAGKEEPLQVKYESGLQEFPMQDLLKRSREKDIYSQRTNQGIHKDDLNVLYRDQPFKSLASQGQRKSLLFALKMAEYELLKELKGAPPLLLLDDVFEKLDADRMHNFLEKVCSDPQAQVFLTDTHEERIREQFQRLDRPIQIIPI